MPQFQIHKEKLADGVALFAIKGYLDAYTYEQFEKTFQETFDEQVYRIIVDLSELQYMSSAGAGVFIGAIGPAQENSGNIVLLRPLPAVKEIFELLGLNQIFTFASSREEALKVFK